MKYIFHEPTAYCKWRKCLLIMRLTIILIVAFVLNAGARGTAQTVTLSVSNSPLEKVCKEIERQTGYYFVYAKDLNQGNFLVNVRASQSSVEEVLKQVFKDLPFSWQIIDKVIVVNTVRKQQPVEVVSAINQPEDEMFRVSGTVYNEQKQPVSEASVTIKATGRGTLTNAKGEFFFPKLKQGAELIISHIGYADQTVMAKEGININIVLQKSINQLDAQVVKGYYSTTNRLNTGNVSTVKGEDITKQPVTDPLLALEGRVPGLSIAQTSGVPGSYSVVRLRGQNSIYSDTKPASANDPLYIVDGVPFSSETLTNQFFGGGIFKSDSDPSGPRQGMSPFNYLNPADIESVDVLKDADATAIYGSRGANGVILITTKKGKIGQSRVDMNVSSGTSKVTRHLNLLNTQEYLEMRREASRNDKHALDPTYPDLDYDINGIWDTTRYTDWQNYFFGNAASFRNVQASISGGNAGTQFLIGAGYSKQGTLFPGNYADQKASLHFSLTNATPNNRLSTQLSASYTYDNSNMPAADPMIGITLAPDAPSLYDKNGNLNWEIKNGAGTFYNPLAFTVTTALAKSTFLSGNLSMSYQLLPKLRLSYNAGYSRGQLNQINSKPSTYYIPPGNKTIYSTLELSTSDVNTWIIEPQINYSSFLGQGQLEILTGGTFQQNVRQSIGTLAKGFSNDALITNPSAATSLLIYGSKYSLYRYNAFYGKIGYNLKSTYLINLTARRDGSSRFGPGKQFGNFGAIGFGWIFSKEKFSEKLFPFLSFGKLRGSYGVTGNDQISDYQYLSAYTPDGSQYQGLSGLYPTIIPNPFFAWEKVTKLEAGLELGFLKDRVLFALSYYRNRTGNQLVGYSLPLITGFGSVQANLPATIQNTGLEITLNSINAKGRNFTWNTSFNISVPRNKLVSYPGIENSANFYNYAVGHSLSSKYLYHYTGVDPQSGVYTFSSKSGNGNPSFIDDRAISKPLGQIYYGGMQNSLSVGGFQLDILIQFVKQYGYNYLSVFSGVGTFNQNVPTLALKNFWRKPGDLADRQRLTTGLSNAASTAQNLLQFSDAIISDASFVRLKSISLSYQIPALWQKNVHLQNARIFVQCQNLFTITSYPGMDPETGGLSLPPLRTVTAGFQVGF
jgi:TonB-linked SusC/RagA family outer membrane protein